MRIDGPRSVNSANQASRVVSPYRPSGFDQRFSAPLPSVVGAEVSCWVIPLALAALGAMDVVELNAQVVAGAFFVSFALIIAFKLRAGVEPTRDARNYIYVATLFWVLLDPLQERSELDAISQGGAAEALVYVGLFLLMVPLGHLIAPWGAVARGASKMADPARPARAFWIVLALYLIGGVPIVYHSGASLGAFSEILLAGYGSDAEAGWRRGALGNDLDYFFTICFLMLQVVPFFAAWAVRNAALPINMKIVLAVIALSVPLLYFFGGSRRIFGFMLLGMMLIFMDSTPQGKRLLPTVIFVLLMIAVFLAMQFQVEHRAEGFYGAEFSIRDYQLFNLQRDNIFQLLVTAVSVMPDKYPFTGEIPFLNFLIHPIPRFLWPGKPVSEGFPFVSWDESGATLTISAIGQFFIAQGLMGVIVAGIAYGWAARHWNELVRVGRRGDVRSALFYMGCMIFFVLGVRSFDEIVAQWYSLAFFVGVCWYLRGREIRLQERGHQID